MCKTLIAGNCGYINVPIDCLVQSFNPFMQAVEEERRKGSKGLREGRAVADAELLKAKQALADAEQQRLEAVRQCEAEGHRSGVKLAQASRSLKAAKQETAEACKQAKVSADMHCGGVLPPIMHD